MVGPRLAIDSRAKASGRHRSGWSHVLPVIWFLALACGRSKGVADQDLGDLVIAPKHLDTPIDVALAGRDPAELTRALMRPYTATVTSLGPHTLAIATTSVVEEAGKVFEDRSETTTLELGDAGAYHARYENSADYGRETTFVAGRMYLRPRYQRWHGRAPESTDEPAVLRDQYAAPMAATWDLVGFAAALSEQGAAEVAGRAGRKIVVTLAAAPPDPPSEGPSQRKWRERRRVEALTGQVVIDDKTGVPLAVKLTGTIGFSRDGRQFKLKVSVDSTIGRLGTTPIEAPTAAEVVATPERLREVDDRDFLLDGMAPPIRKKPEGGSLPPGDAKPADVKPPDTKPTDTKTGEEPKPKRRKKSDSEKSEKSDSEKSDKSDKSEKSDKPAPVLPEEPTP